MCDMTYQRFHTPTPTQGALSLSLFLSPSILSSFFFISLSHTPLPPSPLLPFPQNPTWLPNCTHCHGNNVFFPEPESGGVVWVGVGENRNKLHLSNGAACVCVCVCEREREREREREC